MDKNVWLRKERFPLPCTVTAYALHGCNGEGPFEYTVYLRNIFGRRGGRREEVFQPIRITHVGERCSPVVPNNHLYINPAQKTPNRLCLRNDASETRLGPPSRTRKYPTSNDLMTPHSVFVTHSNLVSVALVRRLRV